MKSAVGIVSFAAGLALIGALIWLARGTRDGDELDELRAPASPNEAQHPAAHVDTASLPRSEDPQARVALAAPASEPAAQRALAASGMPLAIFRGRLVYESTGQGVPCSGVMLRGVEPHEMYCTTDQEGRFQSRHAMPLAHTLVRPVDSRSTRPDWTKATAIERENGDLEVTIRVQAAPTIAIAGEFPAGLDPATFRARIETLDGSDSVVQDPLRLCGTQWFVRGGLDDFLRSEADLEMRLEKAKAIPVEEPAPRLGPPWRLRLENAAGTQLGIAQIGALEGVITATPRWQAFGAIEVSFSGNWSVPPPWQVDVVLRGTQAGGEAPQQFGDLNRLARDPMQFTGLTPGVYTLIASGQGCTRVELPVIARSGELVQVDVQLDCVPIAGSIRGEIVSESGAVPKLSEFANVSLVGSTWHDNAPLIRDPESTAWKARFEFKAVPAGAFRLSCGILEFGLRSSHPDGCRAGDNVQLVLLDRPAPVDLGFRVFDAQTGAELPTYSASLCWNLESFEFHDLAFGAIAGKGLPETGWFSWSVSSPGYVSSAASVDGPVLWSRQSGNQRWIDVRLQPGWSRLVWVHDAEFEELIVGATVLVDGVAVGTTDELGQFTLVLPACPKSIDVRYRDWRCTERPGSPERLGVFEDASFWFARK